MPEKSTKDEARKPQVADPVAALKALTPAAWAGTAWMELWADLGSEITSFVAERIHEDVKAQHKMLHCKSLEELQHVQAEFVQRALDQYAAETGKVVEMSGEMLAKLQAGTKPSK